MIIDYINIVQTNYPGTQCSVIGDSSIYANIIWIGTPIVQSTLDNLANATYAGNVWTLIKTERDRRIAGGVKVGTSWFNSDSLSRIQQIGLVMFGTNMPTGIMWKLMDGTFVSMTPTLAGQIFQAVAASDEAIFTYAEQKKAGVYAATDPSTYVWLTGWPLIYGE